MAENKRKNKKRRIWIISILAVVALAGAAILYFTLIQKQAEPSSAANPGYKTTTVRVGDLTISASGTGTLAAGRQANLSFPIAGEVAELNVKMGDAVTSGEVLAKLADTSSLEVSLAAAQLALTQAQKNLDDLTTYAQYNLAYDRLTLAQAQQTYDEAADSVVKKGWARCDRDTLTAYYDRYQRALSRLDEVKNSGDASNSDYYLGIIKTAQDEVDTAYANYTYCTGYTDYEIVSSQADLVVAQGLLTQAQAKYDTLNANNGIDPIELAQAKLDVEKAGAALEQAQKNLDNATLEAPFDGIVLSVAGEAGDTVGTGTFITIIDMLHPKVTFMVDEADSSLVSVGKQATMTFDALPDDTYTGSVTEVSPSLNSTAGYRVLEGVIKLELTREQLTRQLLNGMSGSVEIISGSAKNTLLVPVEAVRDLGDGTYGVMKLGSDGKLKLTVVTIGLQDDTYIEIKSGLSQGDVISTGITETD